MATSVEHDSKNRDSINSNKSHRETVQIMDTNMYDTYETNEQLKQGTRETLMKDLESGKRRSSRNLMSTTEGLAVSGSAIPLPTMAT